MGLKLDPGNKQLTELWKTADKKCREQEEPIAQGMKKFFQ
jgi:hypothetical protein